MAPETAHLADDVHPLLPDKQRVQRQIVDVVLFAAQHAASADGKGKSRTARPRAARLEPAGVGREEQALQDGQHDRRLGRLVRNVLPLRGAREARASAGWAHGAALRRGTRVPPSPR